PVGATHQVQTPLRVDATEVPRDETPRRKLGTSLRNVAEGHHVALDAEASGPFLAAALGAHGDIHAGKERADAAVRETPVARSVVRDAAALAGAVEGPDRQAEAVLAGARQLGREGRPRRQRETQPLELLPARRLAG